jgi:fructan beta-fructosidase
MKQECIYIKGEKMQKRIKISENNKYLVFPIQAKQEKKKIFLYVEDSVESELNIPVGVTTDNRYHYDFLAYLPMTSYIGREIILEGDVSDSFMKVIHTSRGY